MAVSDGLRVADQVGGGAEVLARAARVEAEAGAHVVHREQVAVRVAERAKAREEAGRGSGAGDVIERGGHHHRDAAALRREEVGQPVEIGDEPLGQLHHARAGQGRQSPPASCSATAASTAGWP